MLLHCVSHPRVGICGCGVMVTLGMRVAAFQCDNEPNPTSSGTADPEALDTGDSTTISIATVNFNDAQCQHTHGLDWQGTKQHSFAVSSCVGMTTRNGMHVNELQKIKIQFSNKFSHRAKLWWWRNLHYWIIILDSSAIRSKVTSFARIYWK